MIDKPVQLAYENIEKLEWWNQDKYLVRYSIVYSRDRKRKAIIIYDNLFNAWAFEVSRHYPMIFLHLLYSWNHGTYKNLKSWVTDNL